jgi:hypothetical protein
MISRPTSDGSDSCEVVREILISWRSARAARAASEHGSHDWANVKMADRFWREEFHDVTRSIHRRQADSPP